MIKELTCISFIKYTSASVADLSEIYAKQRQRQDYKRKKKKTLILQKVTLRLNRKQTDIQKCRHNLANIPLAARLRLVINNKPKVLQVSDSRIHQNRMLCIAAQCSLDSL